MINELLCWIFGHKSDKWRKTGGCGIVTVFTYDYRRCKRCDKLETKNHTEEYVRSSGEGADKNMWKKEIIFQKCKSVLPKENGRYLTIFRLDDNEPKYSILRYSTESNIWYDDHTYGFIVHEWAKL